MALYEYQFDISTTFTGLSNVTDIDFTVLQQEIDKDSIITPSVHHILGNLDDDNCIIYFEEELTAEQETQLPIVLANHSGLIDGEIDYKEVQQSVDKFPDMNFVFGDSADDYHIQFSNPGYKIGVQFIFNGIQRATPKGCRIICKGHGSIRLYDRTNQKTVFEWNNRDFGNDFNIWSFTPFIEGNLPVEEAIFEIQGKKTGSANVYLSSFQLTYTDPISHNPPLNRETNGDDNTD